MKWKTENGMAVDRSWEEDRLGNYRLIGMEFPLGKMKEFWRWEVVMAAQQCRCTSRTPKNW